MEVQSGRLTLNLDISAASAWFQSAVPFIAWAWQIFTNSVFSNLPDHFFMTYEM